MKKINRIKYKQLNENIWKEWSKKKQPLQRRKKNRREKNEESEGTERQQSEEIKSLSEVKKDEARINETKKTMTNIR